MKLIVCLDDRDGMLFLKRRQSQDSLLRERMLELTRDTVLWMNSYSAGQFPQKPAWLQVHERFWECAAPEDYCFAENVDVKQFQDRVRKVVIYRWNRHYPSDVKFPAAAFLTGMQLLQKTDFPGSSHEMITEEVYGNEEI